jgi:hypothetical protein
MPYCGYNRNYALKSLGFLSTRLHLVHSAMFLSLPAVKTDFILTSPPHPQKNLWVTIPMRAFLLISAIKSLLASIGVGHINTRPHRPDARARFLPKLAFGFDRSYINVRVFYYMEI